MRHDTIDRALIVQVCEQPPRRELALSERPLVWLVERHSVLSNCLALKLVNSMELRVEIESIEDEIIDHYLMGELERTKRLDISLWKRAQQIIQRGSNR